MLNLPHDVIVDILSRLPVKNLLQLRCVCKLWCSLIYSSQFAKIHLKRASQNNHHRLLLSFSSSIRSLDYENAGALVRLRLEFPQNIRARRFKVLGSCNGLICLCFHPNKLFLCNPSTRVYKKLPKPELSQTELGMIGFGYDSAVDDYKVVRVVACSYNRTDYGYDVEVYTLKTDSWKRIQGLNDRIIGPESGIFLNGALHWLLLRGRGNGCANVIVAFDLTKEMFHEVMPLPNWGDKLASTNLGVLGGCLCIHRGDYECDAEMWIMKEYGLNASWTKLINIPWGTRPEFYDTIVPVCLSMNDEILLLIDGTELVMYNSVERTSRQIFFAGSLGWFEASVYVESLVLPRAVYGIRIQEKGNEEEASVSGEDLNILFSQP